MRIRTAVAIFTLASLVLIIGPLLGLLSLEDNRNEEVKV